VRLGAHHVNTGSSAGGQSLPNAIDCAPEAIRVEEMNKIKQNQTKQSSFIDSSQSRRYETVSFKMTNYTGLTVGQLKALLKTRSLPVSGLKSDLIGRLEQSDSDFAAQIAATESNSSQLHSQQ